MPSDPQETSRATLHGIGYRIQRAEPWTIIFAEESPIGGPACATRFILHRPRHGIWQFSGPDNIPAAHIVAAYEWCRARVGDDHDQEPLPDQPIVRHAWRFDEQRRRTFCAVCGAQMCDQTRYRSCATAKVI